MLAADGAGWLRSDDGCIGECAVRCRRGERGGGVENRLTYSQSDQIRNGVHVTRVQRTGHIRCELTPQKNEAVDNPKPQRKY